MVVFTCNHCGDSLQKPKVAKHYQTTCRNPIALTCVDCFKDFNLQEYVVHTKCVTELDRYSAKGTAPKILKGEAKQTEWVDTVNLIIEQQTNVKTSVKNVLETLKSSSNIPKKKAKFFNFMKNTSSQRFNMRDIEAVWGLLEKHKLSLSKNAQNSEKSKNGNDEAKKETSENADESSEPKKSKKKNKKSNETQSEGAVQNGTTAEESQKKKKRKAKSKDIESNQTEVIPPKKQKLSETAEENGVEKNESSKKKKKRQPNEAGNIKTQKVTPSENGVVKDESSKKKKKKKGNSVQNNESQETSQKATVAENGVESSKKKLKLKKKTEEMDNSTSEKNQNGVADESFSFKPLILEVLAKKSKGISREVLLTKVLKKYESMKGPIVNKKSLLKKYNKNLKALQNVSCNNDTYKLVE